MKNITLPFFLLLFSLTGVTAQQVDFDRVIPPEETSPASFEELLVKLAWMNTPTSEVLQRQREIAQMEVTTTKLDWTRAVGFNIGFNRNARLNEPDTGMNDAIIFPRVSVGASLNINPLITTPTNVKMARENVKVAEAEINLEKLRIRKEVLLRYKRYLLAIEVLKVRTQMEEDASATYQLANRLFKNNELNFEEYNQTYSSYHSAVEGRLEAQTEVQLATLEIEELIGIPLNEAEGLMR